MFGLPIAFYGTVFLWALLLHGVWEYGQVLPLYRCWERWSRWQRIWILPAATLGDTLATVAFTAGTAAALGPAEVLQLSGLGAAMLLALGFGAGIVFETVARGLDFWRYKDVMPTIRVAGHDVGVAPIVQMIVLPTLAVWIAT